MAEFRTLDGGELSTKAWHIQTLVTMIFNMQATAVILSTGLELLAVHRTFLHWRIEREEGIYQMVFETAIVAALIAAVAALIAARHTSQSTSRQSKRDKKAEFLFRRAEMGHSRKLELYARAFEITGNSPSTSFW